MHTLANSEYPALEIHFYVEIITCDPSVFTMDHPKFIASNQKEESIHVVRLIVILISER